MDLSEPASIVLAAGSAAVVRALSGADDVFTGRQLSRLAGVSHTQAIKVANRLAQHGLVFVEERGSSKLYRFNRSHLAADAIVDLVRLHSRLRARLAERIGQWPVSPLHVSMFGSGARGDGNTASELDILVVRPDPVRANDIQWTLQLADTADWGKILTGNDISWFDITPTELRQAVANSEPVAQEWLRDGFRLFGVGLNDIVRKTDEAGAQPPASLT